MMRIDRVSDARRIALLNQPVQTLHHELHPEKFKKYDFDEVFKYFNEIIHDPSHHFYVCFNEKEAIGYVWFQEIRKQETAFSCSSHYLYIHQISVNGDQRGKGIGKLLLNEVLKVAKAKSIKRIGLDY